MNRAFPLPAVVVLAVSGAATPRATAQPVGFVFVQQPSVVFANNHFPTQLAASDFNGDGHVDLVVAGRDVDGFAYLLFNDGTGAFLEPVPLVTGGQTDWVEVGDVDADGIADLVFAYRSRPSGLALMRGSGGGQFRAVEYFTAGRELRGVALRDFDGDGDLDAAGVDYTGAQMLLWSNDGNGSFSVTTTERLNDEFFGFPSPNSIVAGDLDNDGDQDLVATSLGASRVNVLLNHGDGSFLPEIGYKPPQTQSTFPAVSNSALGDMDGDGDLDIVTPWIMGYMGQIVGVLPNATTSDAPGSFSPPLAFPSSFAGVSWWPALGDFDGDGDLDVAVGYGLPGPLGLMMNVPLEDSFVLLQLQTYNIGQFVRCILPLDVDDDADLDLVLLEAPSNQVIVMRNDTPQSGGAQDGGIAGGAKDAAALAAAAGPAGPPTASTGEPGAARDRNGDGAAGNDDLAAQLADDTSSVGHQRLLDRTPRQTPERESEARATPANRQATGGAR